MYFLKGMLRAGLPVRVAMRLKVLILILNKSHDAYILYSKQLNHPRIALRWKELWYHMRKLYQWAFYQNCIPDRPNTPPLSLYLLYPSQLLSVPVINEFKDHGSICDVFLRSISISATAEKSLAYERIETPHGQLALPS